jgi:uncharacterized protein
MRDDTDHLSSNPSIGKGSPTIGDIIERRLSRRGFLAVLGASSALSACDAVARYLPATTSTVTPAVSSGGFTEIVRAITPDLEVPVECMADVVIRWGDALFADSPDFDPYNQTREAQSLQFGYNNDFLGLWSLGRDEEGHARALLCANHEYTSTPLMFPGIAEDVAGRMTAALCDVEKAAHGGTIVEIVEKAGRWEPVIGSPYNRRIMGDWTEMELTGPAAGHARLMTNADPTGRRVLGTINNCAGGITAWGTYLMAEENFNSNFLGAVAEDHPEAANHNRYGVPGAHYMWGKFDPRFDLTAEPREPNRFGWVVEVDILDPSSTPKKRTALGRFKHEGAESIIAPDGRVVVYMGDDQRFDYVYKFISRDAYRDGDRAHNMTLLDHGTLYVARFDEDGSLAWLPLTFGEGPLTEENGFDGQGEVMIETRRAADLLGATPMDRPEDVEPHPATGRVYVMLTNNSRREVADAANPRTQNRTGHIIEIVEPDGDFTATRSSWEILVRCGNPADPEADAVWNPMTSENGWFGSPDNCAIDPSGGLWIATDGNQTTGANDGLWALGTQGEERGLGKAFLRAPVGAEVCGPRFTDDGRSVFVAIQHPGDGDQASFENPTTRWPDFHETMPPRPSVVAIRRKDGGPIEA